MNDADRPGNLPRAGAQGARRRLRLGSPRAWAIALGALAVLSFAVMIPLALLSRQESNGVIAAVIGVPCAAVGAAIVRRQRANPLGWLFLVVASCLFLGTDGGDYAVYGYRLGHHLPLGPAALALDQIWGPSLVLFLGAIWLFPDGRLPSRFWRTAFRVYGALFAVLLIVTAVAISGGLAEHPVRVDSTGGLTAVDHPTGWFNAVQGPLILLLLVMSLAFIARQALSWRRAAGERRQQLKWLASGAAVTTICLAVPATFGTSDGPDTLLGIIGGIAWLGVAALPLSMGVAILKYRLYEIDRIISRTLAYAIVTGLLVGVYAGLVLLATEVLQVTGVDRRFNRARYDAEHTVAEFAARLQDTVDPDSVRADLAAVAHAALQPTHVSLWLSR